MSVFSTLLNNSGFQLGLTDPVTNGQEDWLFLFNENDFILTYSSTNPLILIGITPAVAGNAIRQFFGTNNSFKPSVKSQATEVGPRYKEELDFNIAGNSSVIKQQMLSLGYGRVKAFVVNNFKSTDAAIELYGAQNGLLATEAEKSETSLGGWKIKLTGPDKLLEPYPPRSVWIPPVSGTATYASSLAAITALVQ